MLKRKINTFKRLIDRLFSFVAYNVISLMYNLYGRKEKKKHFFKDKQKESGAQKEIYKSQISKVLLNQKLEQKLASPYWSGSPFGRTLIYPPEFFRHPDPIFFENIHFENLKLHPQK